MGHSLEMITLRPVEDKDIESLYAISLATGASGEDAASLYEDGRMMGHIYSAPYAALSPSTCFVADNGREVVGFAVGAIDTCSFEEQLEDEWWPELRAIYADPHDLPRSIWNADQKRCFMIHHPQKKSPPRLRRNIHRIFTLTCCRKRRISELVHRF